MARADSEYDAFVEPGNVVTTRVGLAPPAGPRWAARPPRLPQMPAYHLRRSDNSGITMVNIGVGPSNAKNISDHIAVLRPHAWIMLGHCAGLRTTQQLGDYVLAHGYVREDHVLDEELPLWVPIPPLAEVQVAHRAGRGRHHAARPACDLKRVMRTGTVASTDNRNWELLPHPGPERRFSQSRAIALDMESATIAANGFRFRVPYGTLLCVSDKPLHGEIKLPGMANHFYRERVEQHLRIGIRALELLRGSGVDKLHSRKLRGLRGSGVPVARLLADRRQQRSHQLRGTFLLGDGTIDGVAHPARRGIQASPERAVLVQVALVVDRQVRAIQVHDRVVAIGPIDHGLHRIRVVDLRPQQLGAQRLPVIGQRRLVAQSLLAQPVVRQTRPGAHGLPPRRRP